MLLYVWSIFVHEYTLNYEFAKCMLQSVARNEMEHSNQYIGNRIRISGGHTKIPATTTKNYFLLLLLLWRLMVGWHMGLVFGFGDCHQLLSTITTIVCVHVPILSFDVRHCTPNQIWLIDYWIGWFPSTVAGCEHKKKKYVQKSSGGFRGCQLAQFFCGWYYT